MATFYPRFSQFSCGNIQGNITSLDWYKYVYGTRTFNFPLPNCTTYAYGRIMEQYYMNGYDLSVRTSSYNPYWWNSTGSHYGNAEEWYDSPLMTWERGSTPKLGAIACFDGSNRVGGHVAIVEAIDTNGKVALSESAYGGTMFHYRTNVVLRVGEYDSWSRGKFQGYIYIPLNYEDSPQPPTPSGKQDFIYRRGSYVKIIRYGRASSTGRLPIAKGIGWKKQVLRVFKDRPFPIQVGDLRSGITTGYFKPQDLQLIQY